MFAERLLLRKKEMTRFLDSPFNGLSRELKFLQEINPHSGGSNQQFLEPAVQPRIQLLNDGQ